MSVGTLEVTAGETSPAEAEEPFLVVTGCICQGIPKLYFVRWGGPEGESAIWETDKAKAAEMARAEAEAEVKLLRPRSP